MYITLPMLIISYVSIKLLSQLLDDTKDIILSSFKISKLYALFVSGNILLYGIKTLKLLI